MLTIVMQQPVVERCPGRRKHPGVVLFSGMNNHLLLLFLYHKLRHRTLQLPVIFLTRNIGYS